MSAPVRTLISVPPGPLGVTLGDTFGPNGGYLIVAVKSATCPVKDQVSVGDEIVAVDGTDLTHTCSKATVIQKLRETSNRNRFLVVVLESNRFRTSIQIPAGPLGVTMSQQIGKHGGRIVDVVKQNCPVPNLITVGDEVVGVDTTDLTNIPKTDFLEALRESANRDRFLVIIRPHAEETVTQTMNTLNMTMQQTRQSTSANEDEYDDRFSISKTPADGQTIIGVPPGPLGVTLGDTQGPNGGFLVQAIRPICPIHSQISVGDEVLAVDQTNLTNLRGGKSECVNLLRATADRNRVLVIARKGTTIAQRQTLSREESASMIDALASIFGATCSTTIDDTSTSSTLVEPEDDLIPPTPKDTTMTVASSFSVPKDPTSTASVAATAVSSPTMASTEQFASFRSEVSEAPVIGTRVLIGVPPGPLGLNLSERIGPNGGHLVEIVKGNCPFPSQVRVGDEVVTLDHTDLTNQAMTDVVNTLRLSAGRDRVLVVVRVIGTEDLSGKDV